MLGGDLLPRTVIEGVTEGKKTRGKPRKMMLNWMMVDSYGKLKKVSQQ